MSPDPERRPTRPPKPRRREARAGAAAVVVAVVLIGVVGIAVGSWALASPDRPPARPMATASEVGLDASVTVTPPMVEVPELVGMTLEEAQTLLSAAGMAVRVRRVDPAVASSVDTVAEQDPVAGVLVETGAAVSVVVRAAEASAQGEQAAAASSKARRAEKRFVVCIDPGHQSRSNSAPEPIGPGSKEVKPKVTGGATGVVTRVPEYEIVLQIAMNLKQRLEAHGVEVVLTRTTNDVNVSNAERAQIANRAKADLLVRVHCDGSPDAKAAGTSTLYPAKNRWTKSIAGSSRRAAQLVQSATVGATGSVDRGVVARNDLAGFNHAKMPAVLVETGFLSNPVEDRLLVSPHYQDKISEGMAAGIITYLEKEQRR